MKTELESKKQPVYFTWDMHYECNYRCPYCWAHGMRGPQAGPPKYPPLETVLKSWENIYARYGKASIALLGGEPLIYPEIVRLVKELSAFHRIEITSNLSANVAELAGQVDSSNVKISGSFHPSCTELDTFLARALALKEKGFGNAVLYVAYPPQLELLPHYAEKFRERGFVFSVHPFRGRHNGADYPGGYTEEEKAVIAPHLGVKWGEEFQLEPKVVKGRLCCAGQFRACIKADGAVYRCGPSPRPIGNFFSGDFKLLEKPSPCESETCPCNDWADHRAAE